jgi:hypothetical protein
VNGKTHSAQGIERRVLPDHERKDANVKAILILTAVFLAGGGLMHLMLWSMLKQLDSGSGRLDEWAAPRFSFSAPHTRETPQLQVAPAEDLEEFRRKEEELLHTYGWVDRKKGIARVPIDVAMELALKKGFPTRRSTNDIALGASPLEFQQSRAGKREAEQNEGGKE